MPEMTKGENFKVLKIIAPLFIFLSVFSAYSNTFQSSWHFDDHPIILENPHLQIQTLTPSSIKQAFFAHPGNGRYTGERLYRPVSCLTFALNWYIGNNDVFVYHLTNLIVHCLSALFIYLCSIYLLMSPNLKGRFEGSAHGIALLTALIWAVHPIQTQAVTYIVQRMASLSAMLCLLSLWLYLQGRNVRTRQSQIMFFLGSAICFLLALGAKENSIILPLSIILIEVVFFQDLSNKKFKKILILGSIGFVLMAAASFIVLDAYGVMSGYNIREFNLIQRLMTQGRILVFYLGQIFFPLPGRFSLEHDVMISQNLFTPWTTLPALLAIISLLATGFMQIRKRPLVAFAILFYFFNHTVESTIIPLELIFEHRNYLPTAFLFLPIAMWIVDTLKWCRASSRTYSGIAYSTVLIILAFLVGSTFLRNDAWATEKTLWESAIRKAPGLARPYQNLASLYYEPIGRYDVALSLYLQALKLRTPSPNRTHAEILTNIGVIYDKVGDYEKALHFYRTALQVSPNELKPRYNTCIALIGLGRFEDALEIVDDLIMRKPEDKDSNNLKGSILLKLGRPDEAIPYLRKSLTADPFYFKAIINIGVAFFQTGKYDQSEKLLLIAHQQAPNQGLPLLCLIENRIRANDLESVEKYLKKLLNTVSIDEINTVLKSIDKNNFLVPLSVDILEKAINKAR